MKKRKSSTNKGFSLIELIIVVAIMAILIAILAPQYLRYVERSRLQKDNSTIGEFVNAIKIANADNEIARKINRYLKDSSNEITFTFYPPYDDGHSYDSDRRGVDGTPAGQSELGVLITELEATFGPLNAIGLSSNTYRNASPEITITAKDDVMQIEVSGWVEKLDESPITKTF